MEIIQDVSFVNSTPVNINVTPTEIVCPGTEINLSVDNLNNTNWSLPADLAGSSSNSFDYLVGTDDVTFSVSGVDVNGCTTSGEIAVEVFPEIVVNANILQAPCESGGLGSISIQISGGQSPFVYKWIQNGEIVLLNSPLLNYPPGDYQLVVQDANGCEFIDEYTIGVDADYYNLEINSQNEADLFLNYTLLTIANDLVFNITSGENTVNVDYSHIAFGPNGKLIIREGSKVRFTECTLTACSSTWKGVRVESDNSTVADAGKIIIENSYIEKARIGILTFDANAFNTDESQHRCGKLDVKNTQFNDCWRALEVQYGLVDNTSNGTLNLCDIRMSQDYYSYWDDFVSQCQFYGVQNFVLQNTTILNDTWQFQWNYRGSGIGGINAKIKVIGDNTLDAKIAGFDRGMDMLTTEGVYNGLEVTGYKFERNHQAILLNNTCYHTIAENVFEVGTNMNINGWNGNYINAEGIVMLGGAYFNISENIFHGIMETAVGEAQGPIGIRIRDSFTSGDMVYKNTFDGFLVANLANGYNFNATQGNGLRYSCNVNSNNVFDFQVSHELNDLIISPFEDFGIGANQIFIPLENPDEYHAVENSFTSSAFNELAQDGQFFNTGMEIDYFSNIELPTDYTEETINFWFGNVVDNDCLFSLNSQMIVDDYISVPAVLQELEGLNDNIFQLDFLITSLVDGGEHNELIQEIDFTVSQNLLQVRDKLISASPFVSMEVFLHLLDKPETFTNLFCLEILMLNPDLLRSDKLFIILTSKESPFTTEQIELLRSLRSSKDMKWELLHERDVQALLKFDIELGLKMKAIYEGTISISDYLSADMTQAEYSEGMMKLDALLAGKNYALAQTELGIFKQNTKSPVIGEHLNDYSEWINFCVQIDSIGMDFTSLSEDQMFFLREHSINSSWSGRIAQKLLEYYYNEDGYSNPFVDYRMFNQTRSFVIADDSVEDLLYPNPANDLVYLSVVENELNFQILNSLGQVVMENIYFSGEPIDISALPVGQYILKMLDTSISPMRFTKL